MFDPTISRVIKQLKGVITKKIGRPVWRRSFYNHIMRNEPDYLGVCEYIASWLEDELYTE